MLLVSVNDITERNRLERELRERAEELDGANRSKAEFIAVLSHELRTPLNAISGWVSLLQNPGLGEEDRRKGIEIISRNAKMQAQLIADLLDVHRIATGKLSLELRTVDFRREIEGAIDAALPASRDAGIRIESGGETDPVPVLGDSARIQQVLGNLLSNAIKFTPAGGEIRVALRQEDGHVEMSLSDSGEGISPETLPYIFERFRQSETLASRQHGGLGLGLAVSKQLVELHGGSIAARSPGKGKGATFTVSLPLASESRPSMAVVARESENSPVSLTA
jgi:signal transduction histidine kinase